MQKYFFPALAIFILSSLGFLHPIKYISFRYSSLSRVSRQRGVPKAAEAR